MRKLYEVTSRTRPGDAYIERSDTRLEANCECGQNNADHLKCDLCSIGIGPGHIYTYCVEIALTEIQYGKSKQKCYQVDQGCADYYRQRGMIRYLDRQLLHNL
jgi:hypothetical protein